MDLEKLIWANPIWAMSLKLLTCYKPGRSKTLFERGGMGSTFSKWNSKFAFGPLCLNSMLFWWKHKNYIYVGAWSYLSYAGQPLNENGFTCFAVRDNLCRVGFSGSPERPTGHASGCFFSGKTGPGFSGSPDRPTGVLKAVFFSGKWPCDFLEALYVQRACSRLFFLGKSGPCNWPPWKYSPSTVCLLYTSPSPRD